MLGGGWFQYFGQEKELGSLDELKHKYLLHFRWSFRHFNNLYISCQKLGQSKYEQNLPLKRVRHAQFQQQSN